MKKLINLTKILRSKNAGPFYITFDIMFDAKDTFEMVKKSNIITEKLISNLYKVEEKNVLIIYYDIVNTLKITIKRKYSSGDIMDTDVFGAQQQAPLEDILIP